jgi:N-acetylneuraminic acid mutarotase
MKYKLRTPDDQLPYRRSLGESGFSSVRLVMALLLALTVCWIAIGIPTTSGLALRVSEAPVKGSYPAVAGLTFADRVAYQRAIEEIYWRHRIWPKESPDPKPPLDAVMSQAELEKKVQDYLRDSQALGDYWHRPITAKQLQAEMDRMAQHTKQPEVLRELFEALENDPFVIAECLARPLLTERLLSNHYETVDHDSRQRTEIGLKKSSHFNAENQMPDTVTVPNNGYSLPTIADGAGGCTDDTWTATAISPAAREEHTAVWTGTEMIVWGGLAVTGSLNTGGRYNPSTDSWTATSTTNAPSARWGHTAVWTGSEMIIWGGADPLVVGGTGGRYNPVTNSWTATSTTNAPAGRVYHTAVWTGSEMIVWGGGSNDGGKYNPNTNSWTATETTNAPSGRSRHTAVWTGSKMIIWGGSDCSANFLCVTNTGGRYNPSTDSWTVTSDTNVPAERTAHTAVWTGNEMIVWGGFNGFTEVNTGGRYNPSTDSWTESSMTNAPSERGTHTAVWTGSEMIVWGGFVIGGFANTGGRYDPVTDSWTATSTANAPTGRAVHTAVWTGNEMIVWGGYDPSVLDTGGRYCGQSGPSHSRYDFNGDGYPDYVLYNTSTRQTAIWYLNNNVYIGGALSPTLPPGWVLIDVADFNGDSHPDYALFNPNTHATAIWYLNNNVYVNGAYGPSLPSSWHLVGDGRFQRRRQT